MLGYEFDEKIRPIISDLISAVHVEGNLLHSLRITPNGNTVVFQVASINAATKIQTAKEKTIVFPEDNIDGLMSCCENFVKPVGFTIEGATYHWFFFPDMDPMDSSLIHNELL